MDPSGHARPREDPEPEPQPEPRAEGTVARLIREGGWGQRWPAKRCRTALRAAQLRLLLGLFQSERLTARCPLELESDVLGGIAACIRVTLPAPIHLTSPPAFCGLALGLVSDSGPRRSR